MSKQVMLPDGWYLVVTDGAPLGEAWEIRQNCRYHGMGILGKPVQYFVDNGIAFEPVVVIPQSARESLREALAKYAHDAWSGWMKYLFEKGHSETLERPGDKMLERAWIMPQWAVERWTRQMNTEYADLPEEEKKSDREEADRMLAIMQGGKDAKN